MADDKPNNHGDTTDMEEAVMERLLALPSLHLDRIAQTLETIASERARYSETRETPPPLGDAEKSALSFEVMSAFLGRTRPNGTAFADVLADVTWSGAQLRIDLGTTDTDGLYVEVVTLEGESDVRRLTKTKKVTVSGDVKNRGARHIYVRGRDQRPIAFAGPIPAKPSGAIPAKP